MQCSRLEPSTYVDKRRVHKKKGKKPQTIWMQRLKVRFRLSEKEMTDDEKKADTVNDSDDPFGE